MNWHSFLRQHELPLYEQMGFKSFHTLVGTEEAAFQPMYVTPAMFEESSVGGGL